MNNKLAFIFPGQGSQAVGMLDPFIADNPDLVADICAEASSVLGYDMLELIARDPEQCLNHTEYTQPALLTAGFVAWKNWQESCDQQPILLAGHSLGEYTALVCAGAITFAEGLQLVAKRGQLMQSAVPSGEGAMAAILGLELSQIEEICANVDAQAANINAPGQIVVAGTSQGVDLVIDKAKALGAKRALLLPVSVPSHCYLMRDAAEQLGVELRNLNWRAPKINVVHNYDVQSHVDSEGIINALEKQLFSPVRWIECIEFMVQQCVSEFLECGPGKVLTGLNKRIVPAITTRAMSEHLGVGLC